MPAGRHRDDGAVWHATEDGLRIADPDEADAWIEMTFEAGVDPAHRLFFRCPDCGFVAPQRTPPGRGVVCPACDATFERH